MQMSSGGLTNSAGEQVEEGFFMEYVMQAAAPATKETPALAGEILHRLILSMLSKVSQLLTLPSLNGLHSRMFSCFNYKKLSCQIWIFLPAIF